MTNSDNQFMRECIALLEERSAKPNGLFWLIPHDDQDYCGECIQIKDPVREYGETYDGFWDGHESDSSRFCTECGAVLSYSLTDYGVSNELEHFLESGLDWDNPVDCYELDRVATEITTDEQRRKLIEVFKTARNQPSPTELNVRAE